MIHWDSVCFECESFGESFGLSDLVDLILVCGLSWFAGAAPILLKLFVYLFSFEKD